MKKILLMIFLSFMLVGCGEVEEEPEILSGMSFEITRIIQGDFNFEDEQLSETGHSQNKLVFNDNTVDVHFNDAVETLDYYVNNNEIFVNGIVSDYIKISGNIIDWKYDEDTIFVYRLTE